MLVPPFAWGRYYHKMLSHYILWLLTLVPEGPHKLTQETQDPIPYGLQILHP